MKVYSGESTLNVSRMTRLVCYLLLIVGLTLSNVTRQLASVSPEQEQKAKQLKDTNEKLVRLAQKSMHAGKYDDALKIYNEMIDASPQDISPRLGASLAYLKMQNYVRCFEQATEAININKDSARAHALAGIALLRSGFIRGSVSELQQSLNLDPKEPLAYGGAAEIDYYEGRPKESRTKAYYAHQLDPEEPDYLVTYARSSSRVEDFKEAADAYELFLEISPQSDGERRDRIKGLIQFYRQLAGLKVHQVSGPNFTQVPFQLGTDRRPYVRLKINGREAVFVIDTGSGFTVMPRSYTLIFVSCRNSRSRSSVSSGAWSAQIMPSM